MGLSDLGGRLKWGEAFLLVEAAISDPGTFLGAEMAGWAYPAKTIELLSLITAASDPKATDKIMPWAMARSEKSATVEEVEKANADLESGIVFS
ncbi:putative tail assembly chaperone protein [Rathayibacter phage NCPPB3778]|nr:putative tail assembly chaperone protein [Rathayibacter phage NCPPB3778]